ncbi:MAG: hypothetical protein RLW61_01880 [Gammaproteobacteria bacterium]
MPVKALSSLPEVAIARAPALAPRWQVGQLLTAEVIGTASQNYTRLRIGNEVVNARTALPLQAGERLALTVSATSPEVVLKPAAVPHEPLPAVARGLARALPRQGAAEDTLALLRNLSAQPAAPARPPGAPSPSAALVARVAAFLQRLPEQATLVQPERLRAVLEQAAQPRERQLHAGAALSDGAAPSLRGPAVELARLQRAIEAATQAATPQRVGAGNDSSTIKARSPLAMPPAPTASAAHGASTATSPAPLPEVAAMLTGGPETGTDLGLARMRELVEGALARIQGQHLQNAAGAGTPGTPFVVELPVRHQERVDLWRFEFVDERNPTAEDCSATSARARVSIRLLLGDAVVFGAELRIAGDSVGIRMGTNDTGLNAALERDARRLDTRMQERGLTVAALVVDAAVPAPSRTSPRQRLVDERA